MNARFALPQRVKLDAVVKSGTGGGFAVGGARVTFSKLHAVLDSTDGKVAARLRVPAESDAVDGAAAVIPASLLKPSAKAVMMTIAEGQCRRTEGDTEKSAACLDAKFPPVEDCYPAPADIADEELYHYVRVSPALLARLFDAVGANEAVGLFIPRNASKPIVAACGVGVGLCMPLTTDPVVRGEHEAKYADIASHQPTLSPRLIDRRCGA
ncbi:MAG: hypothetical protein FJ271_33110 [Planctomycetes bacterium]|nr:hypothetical protein [Planctomycetota bacterium]